MAPAPPPGGPPALSAFLRGIGRRALLFASLQAGEGPAVDAALSAGAARFAAEAGGLPMGRWPARFWRQVLAVLPRPAAGASPELALWPGFAPLAAHGPGARTAMLLALVAGLDEDDGAAALGVDAAAWRLALRRAAPRDAAGDLDEDAWRGVAMAVRDALGAVSGTRLAWWDRACQAALAARVAPPPSGRGIAGDTGEARDAGDDPARRRVVLRLLWAALAACGLALAATFVPWNALVADRGAAPGARAPLAEAARPAARYDAAFGLRHHPDLPRLLAGADALLRDLDFGAWYAAQAGDAVAPPTATDPYAPAPLPAFDALSPAQRRELAERAAASDAMPREARGVLRERWEAWLGMPATERSAVRAALAAFAALPVEAQRPLRDAFAAQPGDLQRGWLLGPRLGAHWAGLQPLLQQVPAAERERLLARLREMDGPALEALALLAQRTPPQAREALRQQLLGGAGG